MVRKLALLFVSLLAFSLITSPSYAGKKDKKNKPDVKIKVSPKMFISRFEKTLVLVVITIHNPGEEFYCPEYRISWEGLDPDGSSEHSDCPPYEPSMANETIYIHDTHEYYAGHHEIKIQLFKGNKTIYSEEINLN